MTAEERIIALGLTLPPPAVKGGYYHTTVQYERLLFVSGHVARKPDGSMITGKLGGDLTVEQGYEAARQVGLIMLATLRAELGSLNKVRRLIKVLGMVNSAPDFVQHPLVINGFSELMGAVFGEENGKGARSAVGMILPHNTAVEVEAIFEVE